MGAPGTPTVGLWLLGQHHFPLTQPACERLIAKLPDHVSLDPWPET